jgi:hypothetical protein
MKQADRREDWMIGDVLFRSLMSTQRHTFPVALPKDILAFVDQVVRSLRRRFAACRPREFSRFDPIRFQK